MLFNNILSGNQMIPYNVQSFDDTPAALDELIKNLSA
jgi:hypothetical protein